MQAQDVSSKKNQAIKVDFRVTFALMPDEAPFFLHDWCQLLGKTRSAVYSMEGRGKLPARIDLGQVGLAWRVSTVRSWLLGLPEAEARRDHDRKDLVPKGKPRGRPRRPALDLNGRLIGDSGGAK